MSISYSDNNNKMAGRRQRGDAMLEALIGVLLTFILGGGVAFVASRIVAGQRDMKVENYAVVELRQLLYTGGAGGTSLCGASTTIPTQTGTGTEPAVTITCPTAAAQTDTTVSDGTTAATFEAPLKVTLTVANSDIGLSSGALVTVGSEQ